MKASTKKKLSEAARHLLTGVLEDGVVLAGAAVTTALDEVLAERSPRAHEAVRRIREAHRALEQKKGSTE